MDVEFYNLSYSVKSYQRKVNGKQILKDVNGLFKSKEVSAIMGPSGAGKSTLLNAISGYKSRGVKGTFKCNGLMRNEKEFHQQSCYITQEDILPQYMYLDELMTFAANLKLPHSLSYDKKQIIIDTILADLSLTNQKFTPVDNLSGGQKKRLSIALELISNPPVFFLDEPTTGLDNVTSLTCVQLLKKLAQQGRAIVCTIHQPSPNLFEMFDQIYVLAKGQCVYQGTPNGMVPFLENVGLPCPKHYSPCDYIIELSDNNLETIIRLSKAMQNGKLSITNDGTGVDTELVVQEEVKKQGDSINKYSSNNNNNRNNSIVYNDIYKPISHNLDDEGLSKSFYQFYYLFKRMLIQVLRNHTAMRLSFIHHLGCAIMAGILFYNIGNDAAHFFSHVKFILCVLVFYSYTNILIPILYFPTEIKLVKKEYFNRWYDLEPYYAALTLAKLPIHLVFNTLYISTIYYLVGVPMEFERYIMFVIIGNLLGITSEGLGLAIGTILNITNGGLLGPTLMGAFLGLATYKIDCAWEVPTFLKYLLNLTFLRSGLNGLAVSMYKLDRKMLNCSEDYCLFTDPQKLIQIMGLEDEHLWAHILFLTLSLVFFRVFAYICLKRKYSP